MDCFTHLPSTVNVKLYPHPYICTGHRHLFSHVNRKRAAPVKLQINYALFHNIELKYRRIRPTLFTHTHSHIHTHTHTHSINMCKHIYNSDMCIYTYDQRERPVYGNIITLRSRMMDTLHTPVTANGNYAQQFSVRAFECI